MCTKGLLTTCSSKILYNFVPTYTAEAVLEKRQERSSLGKTNMDEFAMGSTTERTSAYGVTKIHGIPGMCRAVRRAGGSVRRLQRKSAAMPGSDTGGSIRQPSSFCGGDRHQADLRNGIPVRTDCPRFLPGSDRPIAKDVTDCATTILEAIASHDVKDSTSVQREDSGFLVLKRRQDDVRGMKIGIPERLFRRRIDLGGKGGGSGGKEAYRERCDRGRSLI